MTETDRLNISLFIQRMSMYIQPQDKNNIVSFIHGYELGRNKECEFTTLLSNLLTEKYEIEKRAEGWINQIERLNKSENWISKFKKYAAEVIENE